MASNIIEQRMREKHQAAKNETAGNSSAVSSTSISDIMRARSSSRKTSSYPSQPPEGAIRGFTPKTDPLREAAEQMTAERSAADIIGQNQRNAWWTPSGSAPRKTLGSWAKDVGTAAGASYAGTMLNAGATGFDALASAYTRAADALSPVGDWITGTNGKKAYEDYYASLSEEEQANLDAAMQKALSQYDWRGGIEGVQQIADTLSRTGAEAQARAEDGLGTVGKLGTRAITAGLQMGADALLGGGSAMAPMVIRSFGGGAQETREEGYNLGAQVGVGAATAAIEWASEKLFGGNPVYDSDAGWINQLVGRVAKNPKVLQFLTSLPADLLYEAAEEIIAEVTEPAAQALITGQKWEDVKPTLDDIIEAGVVGAMMAGFGQGGQAIGNTIAYNRAGSQIAQSENAQDYLITYGNSTEDGSKVSRLAERARRGREAGGVSNYTWGALQNAVEEDRAERGDALYFAALALAEEKETGALSKDTEMRLRLTPGARETYDKYKQAEQAPAIVAEKGTDTAKVEMRAEGKETAFERKSSYTRNDINDIIKNNAALAELGINPNGKSYSTLRAEVRTALMAETVETSNRMQDIRTELAKIAQEAEIGERGIESLLSAAPSDRAVLKPYAQAFLQYYNAGVSGAEYVDVRADAGAITESAAQQAYRSGNYDGSVQRSDAVAATPFAAAGLDYDNYAYFADRYGVSVADTIDSFARKLGTEVRAVDLVDGGIANASIDGRVILIEKGNENPVFAILGHEWTHRMQDLDKKSYNAFRDAVRGELEQQVQDIKDNYAKHGLTISDEAALDEAVADYAGQMLADGRILDDFIRKNSGNYGVLRKVWEAIKEIWNKLTGAEKRSVGQAEAKLRAAMEAAMQAEASGAAEDAFIDAPYSGGEDVVIVGENGERLSLKSARHDFENFEWAAFRNGKIYRDLRSIDLSDADIKALFDGISDLVQYIEPNRDILDMNEETEKGDRKYKPFKPNSDPLYKVSLDFSTLCRKRLMTQFIIEQLQLRENRPMSAEEQLAIRDMLTEYREMDKGLQVACAMCYVEAARLKSPQFVEEYLADPGAVVLNYLAKKSKSFSAEITRRQADYKESHGYDRNATKKQMKASDVNEMNRLSVQWRKDYTPTAAEQAIIDKANGLPRSAYLTADNLARLAASDPVIYDAYVSNLREKTHSKGLETGVAYYYGDSAIVSKGRLEGFNRENGLRFDSWSDFQFEHMLDMMTAVLELSTRKVGSGANETRGVKMHGYTKFPEMVRIFGKTGMMFNLSGVSEGKTGIREEYAYLLDENRPLTEDESRKLLVFSQNESIDFEAAVKLRNEFPETAGLQCIGISDEHIRALLRSEIIDYIIPYHTSGMNATLRKMANIFLWKDYQGKQEATAIDSNEKWDVSKRCKREDWHKEPVFSEFFDASWYSDPNMDGLAAMRQAAKNYIQLCEDRGMRPKFQEFTDEENYWKLLIDRKMIDQRTGRLLEQKPVRPVFDFAAIKGEIDKYVDNYDPGRQQRALDYIIDRWSEVPERIETLKQTGAVEETIRKSAEVDKNKRALEKQASVLGNEMIAAQPKAGVTETGENMRYLAGQTEGKIMGGNYTMQAGTTAEQEELSDANVRYSLRKKDPPKKTGVAYKVFLAKDGQLYPPMVANPGGAGTPVGVWLDADVAQLGAPSKTGRMQVQAGGKGTSTGKQSLAFRPGWHLGDIPLAKQFARMNPETGVKDLFPADFVWAECEYAMDKDYQEEAVSYGYTENGKFRHSYAGLPRVPEDGYYRYRTNPNPDTVPWVITGAMRVTRILTDAEVDAICRENGVEPMKRQGGPIDLAKYGLTAGDTTGRRLSLKDMDVYNRTAVLKESTVDKYLADYAAKSSPNYAQAYIVRMSPTDFVNLTTSRAGRQIIEQQTGDLNRDELQKANVQQPIQLHIDHETGEISGHEGRHRAVALARAGVMSIPVLLFDSSNKYNKTPIDSLTLTGQDFGSSRSTASVTVNDLQPLSYANRDTVVEKFTTQPGAERVAENYGRTTARWSIKFSMKSPVEETADLVALHNLTADKLGKALDLGGFPMPSIAVTKTSIPHTNFGDITLVMNRSTVDPQADRRNTVYSADAWTPTFPSIEYEADEKVAGALRKRYYDMRKRYGEEATRPLYPWGNYADDELTRRGGVDNVIAGFSDDTDMMKLYLLDSGLDVPDPVVEETVSRLDDETVAQYEHVIGALGKKAFDELSQRGGETLVEYRKRWWADHGDEFKSAYKNYLLSLGFSADEVDNVFKNESIASWTLMAIKMRNYLREGAEKRTTSTNVAATKDAIRSAVDAEKYDAWLHGLFDGLEKRSGIYNGRDRYTPSGSARSFSSTHYPVTLENIARAMASENNGNSRNVSGFYGVKSLRAGTAKRFSSIAEMHEYEGRLQHLTEEEAQQITEALSDRMTEIMGRVYDTAKHGQHDNPFIEMDRIGNVLMEVTEQDKIAVDSIEKVLAKYGYKIGNELAVDIRNLLFDIAQMPVNIFEAKPERAVRFDEVLAAVVPSGTDARLVQRLKAAGVQSVLEYENGNDADRMAKANSVEGARFSLKSAGSSTLAALRRQNETLREQVDYWRGQTRRTTTPSVSDKDMRSLASKLVKDFGSGSQVEIAAGIKDLAEYMASDNYDFQQARAKATDIARTLVTNASVLTQGSDPEMFENIRRALRQQITISSETAREISDGNWSAFRNEHLGMINLAINGKNGISVDEAYRRLSKQYPDMFPAEIKDEAERVRTMIDGLDVLRPVYENPYSQDLSDAIDFTASGILGDVFAEVGWNGPTFADRQQARVEAERERGRERLEQLRAEKNARIDEIRRESSERTKALLKAEREKRDKRVEAVKTYYREQKAKQREAKAEREARERLLKLARRLQRIKTTVANRALIDELIGELDTASVSITGRTLGKAVTLLEDVRARQTPGSPDYDPDFIVDKKTMDTIERLHKTQISELTLDDVRALTDALINIEARIRADEKFVNSQLAIDFYRAGMETISNIEDTATGTVPTLLRPTTAALRIANYNDDSPLVVAIREMVQGERDADMYKRKALRPFRRLLSDKKFIRDSYGKNAKAIRIHAFDAQTGKPVTVRITPMMRVAIYLHSLNDDNFKHIRDGGLVVPDFDLYAKGKLEAAYNRGTLIRMSRPQMNTVALGMTEQERQFAQLLSAYFNDYAPRRLNAVSVAMDGYEKYTTEHYYPTHVDKNFLNTNYEAQLRQADASLARPGWGEERTGSALPIYLRDANSEFMSMLNQNAAYATQAIPLHNLNRLLNVKMTGMRGSVRQTLNQVFSDGSAEKYLAKFAQDYSGYRPTRSNMSKLLNKLRSNFSGGVLVLSGGTAIKQAASYFTAGAVVRYRSLLKALEPASIDTSFIDRRTAAYTKRAEGFSMLEIAELTEQGKHIPKALNWIQAIDLGTTKLLKRAAYIEVRDTRPDLNPDSDEFRQAVTDTYVRIIEETQPNYSTALRPDVLRSDSDLDRALVMFATQPLQNFNVLYEAAGRYNAAVRANKILGTDATKSVMRAAGRNLGRAVSAVTISAIVFAAMQILWDVIRGKRKKYEDEDGNPDALAILKALGLNVANSGAGMLPPFGKPLLELAEAATDQIVKAQGGNPIFDQRFYGLDVAVVSALTDAGQSIASAAAADFNLLDDPENAARKTLAAAEDIAVLFGVPVKNVDQAVQIIASNVARGAGGKYVGEYYAMRIQSSPASGKSEYYELLYRAKKNDRDAYDELYRIMCDDDAFASATKTAKENIDAGVKKLEKADK